jgi:hypothetical protein
MSHPEAVKVVDASGVLAVPFSIFPGARKEFSFNYSTSDGDLKPIIPPSGAVAQKLKSEIATYTQLREQVFTPINVLGYKVSH